MVRDDEGAECPWEFAAVLATMPDTWRRLLDLHVTGRDGRCTACRSQVRAAPEWPCTVYRAAARARRIAAG